MVKFPGYIVHVHVQVLFTDVLEGEKRIVYVAVDVIADAVRQAFVDSHLFVARREDLKDFSAHLAVKH